MMKKVSTRRLLILHALYSLFANFAHPVEPTFYQQLQLPDYIFGVAFAAMATTMFLFSPFWNIVADRRGPNHNLNICFVFYGFAQLYFFFFAKDVLNIVLARLLAGIFIGGIGVSNIVYLLENGEDENKGPYLAALATINAIFSAFGYLIGGVLGTLSLRFVLGLEVAGIWLLGLMHALLLEDRQREKTEMDPKELISEMNPLKAFRLPREDLSRSLIFFLLVAMLTSFASNCYEQCFNYFIKDQYNFPPSYNGYLKGAVGIITLIANMTIGNYLMRKTRITYSIGYVLLVCALMMAGIVVIDSVIPFIALNVIFFGFNAVYKPLLQSLLNYFSKRSEGPIVGVYNSISNIGIITGSLVSGFIYEMAPKGSFVYSCLAFVLAIICSLVLRKDDDLSENDRPV